MNVPASVLEHVRNQDANNAEQIRAAAHELMVAAETVLGEWLDKEKAHTVTDNSLFMELPRHFENEYNQDMKKLNVRNFYFFLLSYIFPFIPC